MGVITELADAYPGDSGQIPKSAAMVSEVLRQNGYNTEYLGKNHQIADWETSLSGPLDRWPGLQAFKHFYGFIGGETNQWQPPRFRDTTPVEMESSKGKEGHYTLNDSLANEVITYIHNQKSITPDRPLGSLEQRRAQVYYLLIHSETLCEPILHPAVSQFAHQLVPIKIVWEPKIDHTADDRLPTTAKCWKASCRFCAVGLAGVICPRSFPRLRPAGGDCETGRSREQRKSVEYALEVGKLACPSRMLTEPEGRDPK